MNFRLVESKYVDWDGICDEFEQDYLYSCLSNNDIRLKYDMSHREFQDCCNIVKGKHNLKKRPFWRERMNSVKNYYPLKDGFIIQKRIDGVLVYFGFYHSLSVVKRLVELCESVSWNVDKCKCFCANWRDYV